MSWVRLDDAIAEHRKMIALEEREALCGWLNVKAIAWSNRQLADGVVPKNVIRRLASTFLGRIRIGQQVVTAEDLSAALVRVGLWLDEGDDIRIHDYLKYQPSRLEVERKRAEDAQRKREGRAKTSARTPDGIRVDSRGSHNGQSAESRPPDPIRSDPARSDTESEKSVGSLRGAQPISRDHALKDANREIYRMRSCLDPSACHEDFIAKMLASGERVVDWHAREQSWAHRHDPARSLCRQPAVRADAPLPDAIRRAHERRRAGRGAA